MATALQTEQGIGAANEVRRALGAGCLETVYEMRLARAEQSEMSRAAASFRRRPATRGRLEAGYRPELPVGGSAAIGIKPADGQPPAYGARVLTCMRLGGTAAGPLINFNTRLLEDGIERFAV